MTPLVLFLLTAAPIADGTYWVARPGARSCEELQVKGVMVKLGAITFNQRDGRLFAPVFTHKADHVPLVGSCMVEIPTAKRFEKREDCTVNAELFGLGDCEAEVKSLTALASLGLDVEHEDAVKTLKRLEVILKKGGKLWEGRECIVTTVKPAKRGHSVISGGTWRSEGILEPLLYRARLDGTTEWDPDTGGGGLRGTSAMTVPLLTGKDLIVLDHRVLYVDEGVCVAERKKL